MNRNVTRTVLACAVLALACSWALADGNVNFTVISRHLDDDSWDKLQNQVGVGVNVDFSPEKWPIHFAFGVVASGRDESNDNDWRWWRESDYSGGVGELSFGALWLPNQASSTRPYLGVGVAKTFERRRERIDGDFVTDSDNSFGWYVNAGVYWRVGSRLNLGVDGRILHGTKGHLFDIERSSNYKQIALLVGFGF